MVPCPLALRPDGSTLTVRVCGVELLVADQPFGGEIGDCCIDLESCIRRAGVAPELHIDFETAVGLSPQCGRIERQTGIGF